MKQLLLFLTLAVVLALSCHPCYREELNQNCRNDEVGKDSYTLHMSVHPHLDAFWIFNFESYYDPKPTEGEVRGYFMSNRFNSVKEIFTTAKDVLWESKRVRENESNSSQKAHRTFFNSEMGFFKRWYNEQPAPEKEKVKQILKTKYWEILGGGYVEHDEGCAYYDDIIENFELGLHFLKEEFDYRPRVAVSADSFGHSQTSLAILAHLGVEGYFVERSDEHILLQNKTEFIWRAQSANGMGYGALPTHIRWAIHGFEDQFIGGGGGENFCQTKQNYMNNLRNQNGFLKRILKSTHIMRYFGHDFQRFDDYSYSVIESMMEKFSMEKCNKVVAVYGNPTEYFITLMGEVFGQKVKPVVTRSEDIFPIWDYDSGLYWTGYFTTDAYHKKGYRDLGRYLHGVRKLFVGAYIDQPKIQKNVEYYQLLEEVAQQVSYLQHHDGISGTSKYRVMDDLERLNDKLIQKVEKGILRDIFTNEFPMGTNNPIFTCHMGALCKIPEKNSGDVFLKILNTDGNPIREPIVVQLPFNEYYIPDCPYEINCFCLEQTCPCRLFLNKPLFTYTAVRLKKVDSFEVHKINRLVSFPHFVQADSDKLRFDFNATHFKIKLEGKEYAIGYKRIEARGTSRHYDHLTRYGTQSPRGFNIRPGKYALGNDPSTVKDFTQIHKVSLLKSQTYTFALVQWKRYKMTTLISIPNARPNEWKVQTISASESYYMQDLYFQVASSIDNKDKFVTDSNGWLTVTRELFKHEDYKAFFSKEKFDDIDGNTYPATAFTYIEDQNDKISINLDRPQGVISYRPGTLWVNFDRLSEDDGKWVYESAIRSEYQKYTHTVTVQNKDYNERKIQRRYDQPLFIQGNMISPNTRVQDFQADFLERNKWNGISNIENLKFSIRPFNDSTTILRVHNLHDKDNMTIGLFAENSSPLLKTFYGRTLSFSKISERSLGGNMQYSDFINSKWNWKNVIDLSEQNRIFNKIFRENITLRPLELRTFMFTDLKFADKCIEINELKYNNQQIVYDLDQNKPSPTREPITKQIEENVIQYMKEKNHCDEVSPILDKKNLTVSNFAESGRGDKKFEAKPVEGNNAVVVKEHAYKVEAPAATPKPSTPSSQPKVEPQNVPTVVPAPVPVPKPQPEIQTQPVSQPQPQPQSPPTPPPTQNRNPTIPIIPQQTLTPQSAQIIFKTIEQKIQTLRALTPQQKEIYFSRKLEMIRKLKAQPKSQ